MAAETLTAERILEATEEVLRRYGPAKATVVDVARVLGVSHGSVYRHFRTKAALREAVTARWLRRTEAMLEEITEAPAADTPEKLRHWLLALFDSKRRKAGGDPEMFATYNELGEGSGGVIEAHLGILTGQLTRILEEGVRAGEFSAPDPAGSAGAVFAATARFHDPGYASEWQRPTVEDEFGAVCDLVLRGLRS
ncbi:TetR family transcriptional regulator [Streptomyces sp. 150FB]|uniref:TetR family transcriptional regulator n=1 Tax=Streptomyces sp. 150FB TaxID=1576605 RepID=UPI00058932C2|nr:TetR family transcriptional regulator [Streptomyces sp. 150FB]KIF74351.1 TetR family transcriptional regulator [Streptomyces sp. 150FB]